MMCLCRSRHKILESNSGGGYDKAFDIRAGLSTGHTVHSAQHTSYTHHPPWLADICGCGPNKNCCGATCCNETLNIDILDNNGQACGRISKQYGGGSPGCSVRRPLCTRKQAHHRPRTHVSIHTHTKPTTPPTPPQALYRCCCMFNNYVVDFPPQATEVRPQNHAQPALARHSRLPHPPQAQRKLIMASVFHLDYVLFEKTGGDNSN